MTTLKSLTTAAAIAALTTPAFAGGLSDQIMEAPVAVEEEMMAPAASSLDPSLVVLGILGLLLIGASVGGDDGPRNATGGGPDKGPPDGFSPLDPNLQG